MAMSSCYTGFPPAERGRVLSNFLTTVLAYVDRPWKLFAVLAMFVVGGTGLVLYERRELIIEAWLTPTERTLRAKDAPEATEKLVAESSVDLAQVWEVSLPLNQQSFLVARASHGDRPTIPAPRVLPAIVAKSDMAALLAIMNGSPVCVDATPERASPVVRRLYERGMRRVCGIPIPPSSENLIGIIYLAWATPPEAQAEEDAVSRARQAARDLSPH